MTVFDAAYQKKNCIPGRVTCMCLLHAGLLPNIEKHQPFQVPGGELDCSGSIA